MARSAYFDPSAPITPSELIFLDAHELHAGSKMTLKRGGWYHPKKLGHLMFGAAILANEHLGSFHLEIQKKRTLLGLGLRLLAVASPGTPHQSWPETCLESQLDQIVISLCESRPKCQINEIIYEWLNHDGKNPLSTALDLVSDYLNERGYLEKVIAKKLGLFSVTEYDPKENTQFLGSDEKVQPIKDMVNHCKSSRPDLWSAIVREIDEAIINRTKIGDWD